VKIPKLWVSAEAPSQFPDGSAFTARAYGWSLGDVAEAKERAVAAARRLAERGVVTRNNDGCLVLNTAGVMFVDVDSAGPGLFARLFGKAKADDIPAPLTAWLAQNPRSLVRVYRTHSGWRYLMTHDLFEPTAASTRETLVALGADPKYVELTRIQESFRARLSPKPWRLDAGLHSPSILYPRETPQADHQMREWLAEYEPKAESFATTRFVAELGRGRSASEADAVVQFHDKATRADSGLPLA